MGELLVLTTPIDSADDDHALVDRIAVGEYVVHASCGQASQSKRIYVGGDVKSETVVLNAGDLRLAAAIAVTATDQNDAIYANASQGDYILLAAPGVGILAPFPKAAMKFRLGHHLRLPT